MSGSKYYLRADPADCWRAVLFGEILKKLGGPARVREQRTIYLTETGHWELGLDRIRPAFDDALASTAIADAWREACTAMGRNAWPGWPLIAKQAVAPITEGKEEALAWTPHGQILAARGDRTWSLLVPFATAVIAVKDAGPHDWSEVDRIAGLTAALLGWPWRVE